RVVLVQIWRVWQDWDSLPDSLAKISVYTTKGRGNGQAGSSAPIPDEPGLCIHKSWRIRRQEQRRQAL
ncbi:MAG: hypothetical protein U1A28_05280, partial [Patescibacteria group bacterium]|nr:hypothetical protein [Patescibacteria group bacterium]